MTTEPKLLTEAEWRALFSAGSFDEAYAYINERGLIAPEPEKTLADHAWQVCVDHGYRYPHSREHKLATAALKRGMELAQPPLTRQMVRQAFAQIGWAPSDDTISIFMATLTGGQP